MTNENQGGEIASLIDYLQNQIPEQQTEEGRQIMRDWIAALSPCEQPEPVAWPNLREDIARLAWTYCCSSEELDPSMDIGWSTALHHYANTPGYTQSSKDFVDRTYAFADVVLSLYAQPSEQTGAGGDSAFKIASDLHTAYEQLIYGLPKYLDAENLTDEENMIREAWITLDVTAHRLAALSTAEGTT